MNPLTSMSSHGRSSSCRRHPLFSPGWRAPPRCSHPLDESFDALYVYLCACVYVELIYPEYITTLSNLYITLFSEGRIGHGPVYTVERNDFWVVHQVSSQ